METEAAHTSEQMCGAYKLHRETTSPLRIRKERGSSCLLSHWDLLIKGATWKRMQRTSRLQSALGARKFVSHPGFTSTPARHCLSFIILHIVSHCSRPAVLPLTCWAPQLYSWYLTWSHMVRSSLHLFGEWSGDRENMK